MTVSCSLLLWLLVPSLRGNLSLKPPRRQVCFRIGIWVCVALAYFIYLRMLLLSLLPAPERLWKRGEWWNWRQLFEFECSKNVCNGPFEGATSLHRNGGSSWAQSQMIDRFVQKGKFSLLRTLLVCNEGSKIHWMRDKWWVRTRT